MPRNLSKAWSLPGSNPILLRDSLDGDCGGLETLEWRERGMSSIQSLLFGFQRDKDSLLAVSM